MHQHAGALESKWNRIEQTYFSGRCKKCDLGARLAINSHIMLANMPMNEITRNLASLPMVHYLGSNTPCASGLVWVILYVTFLRIRHFYVT